MRSLKLISFFIFLILLLGQFVITAQKINVSVNPYRVKSGENVKINFNVKNNTSEVLNADIMQPSIGTHSLKLVRNNDSSFSAEFDINNNSPSGLYAIHAWLGDRKNPVAIGKGTFLYNKIIGDFCYPKIFDSETTISDLENYFREFKSFGGNFIIVHGLITPQKAYYSSKIARMDKGVDSNKDILEMLLKHTDEEGIAVMFSASWDMTNEIPYETRTLSTKKIMEELYQSYSHHPSMIGFYPYQEGSGTYFQPFVKEFCSYTKSLNPGLLTAVAPYMDDPLLAGYLSIVDELDIIIYQSMVMASYRPDNRKKFPFRRVKDFGSVSSGAKQLQNKITLTHVELFGYGENKLKNLYITNYDNIYQQILSAGTVPENDGIILFTFSNIIYDLLKKHPEFEHSRQAVFDGMEAFQLISEASEKSNQISIYFPWADWTIERWANNYYEALDAFRTLGIPVNVLPYAPPLDEAELPYYPYHENPKVLERLLKEKKILVFPSISGFYQTDSDMIKHFIEEGGVVIAFGPQIPMGTSYNRKEIFGIEESGIAVHNKVINKNGGTRTSENEEWDIKDIEIVGWKEMGAEIIAVFEDSSPAITINKYGKGASIAIMTSALIAAENFPNLVRDVIDKALDIYKLKRSVDIIGLNKNSDIAISDYDNKTIAVIINHNDSLINVDISPLKDELSNSSIEYKDLITNEVKKVIDKFFSLSILPRSFRLFEIKTK